MRRQASPPPRYNLFIHDPKPVALDTPLLNNPDLFMQKLMQAPDWYSYKSARALDEADPLRFTGSQFQVGSVIPFAGHSLGPVFLEAMARIERTSTLQSKLHDGHFSGSHPDGKDSGHWFDCDRHKPSLAAVKQILGFADDDEFIFTSSGLSQNLGMLMDTFYCPGIDEWRNRKTKIVMLSTEFFSDQAIAVSVAKRAIQAATRYGVDKSLLPTPEDIILKLEPDANGLYQTDYIIETICAHAAEIKLICLSDIVFSTGQRLELDKIFAALRTIIEEHQIIIGLDLAHSVGNRPIDLKSMPVTFAVGCGYKHLSGYAGSSFGFYVNKNADLEKYSPLQGWKAADSNKVFPTINRYDDSIMAKHGAVAFRTSNPPPVALLPAQTFLTYFNNIGFDKCFNKSECLTRYMRALLNHYLGDKIEWITPENTNERGAMLVLRVKDIDDVNVIETFLKHESPEYNCFEIDTRLPNNIRLTAHYAYTRFEHINAMVQKLSLAVTKVLQKSMTLSNK